MSGQGYVPHHFVGKWHHDDPSHPDYKPSIFPTSHIQPSSEVDVQRHERARKRALRDVPAPGPPARIAKTDEDQMEIEVSFEGTHESSSP